MDKTELIAKLVSIHNSLAGEPWVVGKDIQSGFPVCSTGNSGIDGGDYYVGSPDPEGDAKTDAEGIAELRNLLPAIVRALRGGE